MSTSGIQTRLVRPFGSPRALAKGEALPEFAAASDPDNWNADMWAVVKDPLGSTRTVLRNVNRGGVGDGHATMTTGRDLPKGSHSFRATGFLYRQPDDLRQTTGRNLFWQLQMASSPIAAISTLGGTDLTIVDRVNGEMSRKTIGKIPFGHGMYFVIEVKLADSSGIVRVWYEVDSMPDVDDVPVLSKTGDTYQGTSAHDTIGQYAEGHPSTIAYTGYIDVFGRDTTFAGAVAQAGPIAWTGTPEPPPPPPPPPPEPPPPEPELEPEPEPEPGPTPTAKIDAARLRQAQANVAASPAGATYNAAVAAEYDRLGEAPS